MSHTKTPNGEREFHAEHYEVKNLQAAIGRAIARRVTISTELINASRAVQTAQNAFNIAVEQAANSAMLDFCN